MKKTMKILTVLLVVIMLMSIATNVFAINPEQITSTETLSGTEDVLSMAKRVATFIRNIAVVASVIVIMVLGVKYILGSVEEKAEYKKSFMPLIIGIILVVAASSIASFIFGVAGNK